GFVRNLRRTADHFRLQDIRLVRESGYQGIGPPAPTKAPLRQGSADSAAVRMIRAASSGVVGAAAAAGASSVATKPGLTEVTRTGVSARSFARPTVRLLRAAFDASSPGTTIE